MEELRVQSANHNYPIYVGQQIRKQATKLISLEKYSQIVIMTDDHVEKLYLQDLLNDLQQYLQVHVFVIPSGEQSKSLTVYEDVQKFLLNNKLDRSSVIIALGGGVVGDLAGFVAATYMRGISFIQMPSTLLAQDSSIGGKVGINLDHTKNIIGSFYPPDYVIYDTEMLETLDLQQLRSGFAEMIKHGFISDQNFLSQLRQHMTDQIDTKSKDFNELLIQSLKIKKNIIEIDEQESHIRRYLNFGHTLGHAIEVTSDETLTHGECVMVGMLFALYLSKKRYQTKSELLTAEFIEWIKRLNYSLDLVSEQDISNLVTKMLNDKKNKDQQINFVLLKDIGEPVIQPLSKREVENHLYEFIDFIKDV
ncbi:3-dehydroquinate synthase [Tenuibacillus multivorans]|uniref:3-dehydroquinate synthase n=1 Tax=Tenuibacillus multivorans TaxID=237069 RepID=A0A1H0CUQ2_9BACI|nr:3-dehydroquinate synthase [Tenuibacillus multivorans]GEL76158.1 3-dehydroquinate synthase [Tenuibacillus multivorans]SDN61545.1 3-dehydroquinate synthase [Tenuibacillus multivorans]